MGLLDGVRQEPIAGYVHLTCCQAFWYQMRVLQLSPRFGNDLRQRIPSAQVEAWLVLSEHQQVLVSLAGSALTCRLLEDAYQQI